MPRFYGRKRGPFRRLARRYIRSRVGKRFGSSFISLGSRARVIPGQNRRKYDAISSQNDSDPAVSANPVESGNGASIAPLGLVRFKDPSSTVFDYHHFVRRIRCGNIVMDSGVAGTAVHYQAAFTLANIPDYAELAALYGRYRFTRVVFSMTPIYNAATPLAGYSVPLIFSRIYRGSGDIIDTEIKALNTPEVTQHTFPAEFHISMTPNAREINRMEEAVASTNTFDGVLAPWIDVDRYKVDHWGFECLVINNHTFASVVQLYTVIATVYIDCDEQSLA